MVLPGCSTSDVSMVASEVTVLSAPTGGPKSPSCGIYEVTQAEVIAGQQFSKGKYQINTFGMSCDEVMGDASMLTALTDSCERSGVGAVGLMRVPMEQVSAYGVITPSPSSPDEGPYDIVDVVEKPAQADAPSNLIIIGRYVLTPDVFEAIDALKPHANGELQLTDALRAQSQRSPLTGMLNRSQRWDTGTPMGWLTAVVDIALTRPDIEPGFRAWLTQRLGD